MAWTPADRAAAADLAALAYANPFSPERARLEARLLGRPEPHGEAAWHQAEPDDEERFAGLRAIAGRLLAAAPAQAGEREAIAIYLLYEEHRAQLEEAALAGPDAPVPWWPGFAARARMLLPDAPADPELAHLLACLIQVRRAFAAIFANLVGASPPMVRLRAACWSSVFGADLGRYRACLWSRMRDFPTLVTGPSGSGKELVARAVGSSGYIAVDPRRRRLAGGGDPAWLTLAISALPASLVEAELFGHRRGAFTGASEDRAGWLEVCAAHGAVFLDEIGEVDPAVQVKLLRVLQTRGFARVGEHAERAFRGRLVAATNRDLAAEIAAGRFRGDLYYRLCADHIRTPALRELLAADPGELDRLCLALARRIVGDGHADTVAADAVRWIRRELGASHPWPGNVRELVRGAHEPASAQAPALADAVRASALSADELLDRYCAQVVAASGGLREAGRRLGMDWRTVKARARRGG
jgi:transcriptional regulator with AAA-type ATPase domain